MSLLSLYSKVDQVQSLLTEIQNSSRHLPIEHQNLVSLELEHIASQLTALLQESSRQHEHDESAHSDIDARLKPAKEIEASEPWLGLALKQSRSGAWKWDLIHGKAQWSVELYELLGIDPAKDASDPQVFFEMIHPDDRKKSDNEINEAIKRGGPFYLEFRVLCGNGKTIWLSSAGTVEHDPTGQPIQAAGINQDITDRKRVEAAFQESVARERAKAAELEALMDAVPAMIWISRDPQCKEMTGNRYGYEFLNMWQGANISKTAPDMDLVQQPYRNLKNGQEIPNSELPMQIAASTGVGASNYEFDLVFINGVTKNLLGNVRPLTDQNGKPSGAVAAFVDITERKRMENELRRSETQLQIWKEYLSFWGNATNSYFWVLGPDGSYQEQILTDPRIAGKRFDPTQPWNWLKIVHPEDQEYIREQWQNVIEQQRAIKVEARVWHEASQQYRWFSHKAVPILEAGMLKGWIGASNDIQERKEAELALRESEHRFRVVLASAPMTVFTVDKELRYTWVYNTRHGFTEKQMLGKRADELLAPEDVSELVELKRSVIETGQTVQQEFKIKVNDAWFYYIGALDPVIDQRGRVTGLIGAAFDITTQRHLETVQRENEIQMATQRRLLETREDERTNIARDIHDGPLQTLIGMIFDIHNLKEEVTEQAVKVELASLELSLKNGIRELRQAVSELRPPTLTDFGLVKAIQEHVEEICEQYSGTDLTIDLDEGANTLPEEVSLTVYRICQEAIQNIIRHSTASKAIIRLLRDNDQATLVVQDNGIGFLITNDFNGLVAGKHYGLVGMKERAEAVGGNLQVSSKPGEGTEIKACVPI